MSWEEERVELSSPPKFPHKCPERPRQPGQPPASARIREAPNMPHTAISMSGCARSGPPWGSTAAVLHLFQGTVSSYFVAFVFSFFLLHVVAWESNNQSSHPHISSLCHPSETNPLLFPRSAQSWRQKPWGQGEGSRCPERRQTIWTNSWS